ncbi:MAG: tripartite tricarboxylate transporter substrate binding protein [Burkholderiales bacterium]
MNGWVRFALFLACIPHVPLALAQYPVKPVRLVIGFAPGGGADILARTIAPKLGEVLGQQIVVDNRPGAAGNIGVELVVKSPPDGYTLLMGVPGLVINPSLYAKLPYELARDVAPISLLGAVPNLLVVHPSVPASSVRQLVQLAKDNPGKLNFASSGAGTSLHLAAELFKVMAGVDIVHVAYKGGAPAVADLMGGHVDLMFDVLPSSMPHVKAGKLKALGVTSERRTPLLPDIPTVSESGLPGYRAITWNGILAPAATPRDVINKLNGAIVQVLRTPDMKERFAAIGTEPIVSTPDEFAAFLRAEAVKWAGVIKSAGIKVE